MISMIVDFRDGQKLFAWSKTMGKKAACIRSWLLLWLDDIEKPSQLRISLFAGGNWQ